MGVPAESVVPLLVGGGVAEVDVPLPPDAAAMAPAAAAPPAMAKMAISFGDIPVVAGMAFV